MAWVNKKYECSDCLAVYDDFDEARECCPVNTDWFAQEIF